METPTKFSNLQQELLKLYSKNVSDDDLIAIKDLLGKYFAQKTITSAIKVWDEKHWGEKEEQQFLKEDMRTPYKNPKG
ncbi:MAG TPA: hypothetical protein VE978_27900 [Chitinophagales bacterium]|nr:hypothetical protein [Chitinophagales bacterium]